MSPFADRRSEPINFYDESDLRLLTTLHVLLETLSVTKAANRMKVSQPAVSRSLARARARFDDPLLLRSSGGMVLTPRAERLREHLGAWLAEGRVLLAQGEVDPKSLQRRLRIASTDQGVVSVIEPSLQTLAAVAPQLELSIHPFTSDSEKLLASGGVDLVICGGAPDLSRVHARWLYSESHVGLACRTHPGLQDGRMSAETFFAQAHVAVRVPGGLAAAYEEQYPDIRRRNIIITEHFMMAPYLISGSRAVMTAPSRVAHRFEEVHGLVAFEPPIPLPNFDYWITWHERAQRDAEVQWLIEQLCLPFASANLNPAALAG